MEPFPFPSMVLPGTQARRKGIKKLPEYYCYVSTLNNNEADKAYTYRAFRVKVPKRFLKKAKKEGSPKAWVTFRYGSRNAIERIEADTAAIAPGGIVRVVHCRIPQSQKIQAILFEQFTQFGKASWVSQYKSNMKGNADKDTARVAKDWIGYCEDWGSTCVGGSGSCEDPDNWESYCKSYGWIWVPVYEGDPGGGDGDDNGGNNGDDTPGGGSPTPGGNDNNGGDDSDPCAPDGVGSTPVGCNSPIPPYPPEGIDPAVYEPLTEQEKILCWANPGQCYYVYRYSKWASTWAAQVEPVGAHNGGQDAIRHAAWSGRITLGYDDEVAKIWTDAHEWGSLNPDETKMDKYNNTIGRQVGATVSSLSELENSILNNYQNGNLCTSLSDC